MSWAPDVPALLRSWTTAFLGLLLMQAVWLLVTPPFQGIDEHDHVFKAAAVARGDWSGTHEQVEIGRGELVAVPRDIADAALRACEALDYTKRDDCHPTAELADGRVLIGSSAARYNPTAYAVIGTAARAFQGIAAGYAMRIATAAWSAALLALAIVVIQRTARTRWPAAAALAAFTPTMLYSSSIAAPNGPEMAAGLLLWSALLFGVAEKNDVPNWVVVAGTVAAMHLAVLRSLGPLWLALILGTAALAMGVPDFLRIARSRRLRLPALATVVAVLLGAAWTLTSGTNSPSAEPGPEIPGSPWPKMFTNWLAWLLQQVAAVPSRIDAAPTIVYALVLAVWTMLLIFALRIAAGRVRLAMLVIFVSVSAISIMATVLSYHRLGYAWQGRYAWPYVIGWLVLAGWTLDRSPLRVPGAHLASLLAGVTTAVCGCVTAVGVLDAFTTGSPYAGAGWTPPHPILLCALAATGVALLLVSMRPDRPARVRPWLDSSAVKPANEPRSASLRR